MSDSACDTLRSIGGTPPHAGEVFTPKQMEGGMVAPSHSSSQTAFETEPDSGPDPEPWHHHGWDRSPLPPEWGSRFYRSLRWKYGSVYRRMFCLVFTGNLTAMLVLLSRSINSGFHPTFENASVAVTANLLASFLVRNEHVVNALFWVSGTTSNRLPLCLRRLLAKVHHYGGIHSGCAVAATAWYVVLLGLMTKDYLSDPLHVSYLYICLLLLSYLILVLLLLILLFAYPRMRVSRHNSFECTHRFSGWTIILLSWVQAILVSVDAGSRNEIALVRTLVVSANFWMLIVITLLVLYPWIRLRKRAVQAEVLSGHCVKLSFDYCQVSYGQAIRLSDAPLKETHAFGVVPRPASARARSHTGERGFSVFVSNAGDWTHKIIKNPPTHMYTRGVPQFGVLRVASLFAPVVIVATGSGIAPCLSLFVQKPEHPVRIIWSAPDPERTYGHALVELLYRTDPHAIVINTRTLGRPDLVRLAYRVWEGGHIGDAETAGRCEAVVIISNQTVTEEVVYGLEGRGVAAYGAVFDS